MRALKSSKKPLWQPKKVIGAVQKPATKPLNNPKIAWWASSKKGVSEGRFSLVWAWAVAQPVRAKKIKRK